MAGQIFIYKKGEHFFENDALIVGGKKGQMCNDTSYREVCILRAILNDRWLLLMQCFN